MINVAETRYHGSETKNFACEACRQWFSPRRASARSCSPRCRQRSHRRASRLPPDKIRSANGHSQRNVDKSDRGPSGSAEVVGKSPPPVAQTAAHQAVLASDSSQAQLHTSCKTSASPTCAALRSRTADFRTWSTSRGPRKPSRSPNDAADVPMANEGLGYLEGRSSPHHGAGNQKPRWYSFFPSFGA